MSGRSLGRTAGAARGGADGALLVELRRHESGLHLLVSGELHMGTAHLLRQWCESVDAAEADTVLIDLAELTAMDGDGLDALFAAYLHFGERLVIIVGPPGAHTIDLAGVRDILPIIEG